MKKIVALLIGMIGCASAWAATPTARPTPYPRLFISGLQRWALSEVLRLRGLRM